VHTIISEQLPGAFENDEPALAKAVRNHRAAATYGAMGPDPFFFNLDDLTPDGVSVAREFLGVWDKVGQIQYHINEFFAPLQQTMLEAKRRADQGVEVLAEDDETVRKLRDLLNRLQATGKLHSRVMRGYFKKRIIDRMDPFGFYVSPYQTCEFDHEEWWWFDTLHSRKTGQLTTRLLDIARGQASGMDGQTRRRPKLLSYAVGYLSHLAADVVGHAYVNTMVGGPYRLNQAQRHTTQEKLMDVYAYDHYYNDDGLLRRRNTLKDRYYQNPQLLHSGLHKNQQFTNGKYDPKDYEIDHDRIFERPKRMAPVASGLELPAEISRNVAAAANAVYGDEFSELTPEEVDQSYRLWYLNLRGSTSTLKMPEPSELPDTPPVSEETRQAWQRFESWYDNNVDNKPGTTANTPSCGGQGSLTEDVWDCLQTAAESVWNFASNTAEAASEGFKTALAVAGYLARNAAGFPIDQLNFFLQKLYENLYESYRRLMLLLTSLGFGYCFGDQVDHEVVKHLTDPEAGDHFGNTVKDTIIKPDADDSGYPRRGVQMGPDWADAVEDIMDGISQEGHLVVPTTDVEEPRTIPGPDVYGTGRPEGFISDPEGELSLDPRFIAYRPENAPDTRDPSRGTMPTRRDYRPSGAEDEGTVRRAGARDGSRPHPEAVSELQGRRAGVRARPEHER